MQRPAPQNVPCLDVSYYQPIFLAMAWTEVKGDSGRLATWVPATIAVSPIFLFIYQLNQDRIGDEPKAFWYLKM